jgi:hypothetical protein
MSARASHGRGRGLPDLNQCRAKWAGFGEYVDCQVAKPERCIFSLQFGDGYLCLHTQRAEIVARSQTEAAATMQELTDDLLI